MDAALSRRSVTLGLLVALCAAPAAPAAPGDLDAGFGSGGIVQPIVGEQNAELYNLALDSQGRIVGAGRGYARAESPNGAPYPVKRVAVGRFTAAGALDTTFGSGGLFVQPQPGADQPTDAASGLAVGAGDAIHVAGATGNAVVGLTGRLTPAGALDLAYDGDGIESGGADTVGLLLQTDGKVLVPTLERGGWDEPHVRLVRRLTTAGAPDLTYGGGDGAAQIGSTARVIGLRPDGGLLVMENLRVQLSDGSWAEDLVFSALTPDGLPDTGFGTTTTRVPGIWTVDAVAPVPGGGVVLAGGQPGGKPPVVARILPTLAFDTGFGLAPVAPSPITLMRVYRLRVDAAGRILVAGESETTDDTSSQLTLLRLLSSGAVDTAFAEGGVRRVRFPLPGATGNVGPYSTAVAVLIQPGGRIVLGGWGSTGMRSTWVLVGVEGDAQTAPPIDPAEEGEVVITPEEKDEGGTRANTIAGGSGDGSAPRTLPGVTIAPEVVTARLARPTARLLGRKGRALRLRVTWPPAWRGKVRLRVRTTGRRPVLVASRTLTARAGKSVVVSAPLTRQGRRLLARAPRTRLVVTLTR